MTQRLLHGLLSLFPKDFRAAHRAEMVDALEQSNPQGATAVREGAHLVGAAGRAWHDYFSRSEALKTSVFFGFLAWFSFLVGIGPLARAVWSAQDSLPMQMGFGPLWNFLIAAVVVAAALVTFGLPRLIPAVIFLCGLGLIAWSVTIGDWGYFTALSHELRWLAVPFFAALWLRPPASGWHVKAALVAMAVGFLGQMATGSPANGYAGSLRELRHFAADNFVPGNSQQLSVVLAGVAFLAVLLLPWFLPGVAGVLLAPLTTASIMAPFPITIVPAIYLIAVSWIRHNRAVEVVDLAT